MYSEMPVVSHQTRATKVSEKSRCNFLELKLLDCSIKDRGCGAFGEYVALRWLEWSGAKSQPTMPGEIDISVVFELNKTKRNDYSHLNTNLHTLNECRTLFRTFRINHSTYLYSSS